MKQKRIVNNEIQGITFATRKLLEGQEGFDIDFKEKAEGVTAEDFVAFANGRGGTILIGVKENKDEFGKQYGSIIGCNNIEDKVKQGFINKATSCRPSIDIAVKIENLRAGKPIYRIDIQEGNDKPYCTSSGVYKMRADGQNIAIDPSLMKAMILEKEADEFLNRFKSASEELLSSIAKVQANLTKQISRVENATQEAINAANNAEQAARDAEDIAKWAAYK